MTFSRAVHEQMKRKLAGEKASVRREGDYWIVHVHELEEAPKTLVARKYESKCCKAPLERGFRIFSCTECGVTVSRFGHPSGSER